MKDGREDLRADCNRCVGLCCVVPAFSASADFAINKPAGQACPNLHADSACGIHANLRERGFPGCAAFDCFGAGQQVVQVTFAGQSWRDSPEIASSMFAVLPVMRQLHELLWCLAEALTLLPAGPLREKVQVLRAETERLAAAGPDELAAVDTTAHRAQVGPVLERVSDVTRASWAASGPDYRGADLIGAKLAGADLRGGNLRGAYLIGADLRRADLRQADLLGADLRAADLRAARLDGSIFLTQTQVGAAVGDAATAISPPLRQPTHWLSVEGITRRGGSGQ